MKPSKSVQLKKSTSELKSGTSGSLKLKIVKPQQEEKKYSDSSSSTDDDSDSYSNRVKAQGPRQAKKIASKTMPQAATQQEQKKDKKFTSKVRVNKNQSTGNNTSSSTTTSSDSSSTDSSDSEANDDVSKPQSLHHFRGFVIFIEYLNTEFLCIQII